MSFDNNAASASFAHNKYKLVMGPIEEANFVGALYYARHKFTGIAVANYKDLAITVGAKNLFIAGRSFSQTTDRLDIDVYSTPTFTGGTALPVVPYNSITPILPSETTVVIDPTVTNVGTLFDEFIILGQPDNNADRVGGGFRSNAVLRMIPAGSTFLIRANNNGTVPMDGLFKYLFFERDVTEPLS